MAETKTTKQLIMKAEIRTGSAPSRKQLPSEERGGSHMVHPRLMSLGTRADRCSVAVARLVTPSSSFSIFALYQCLTWCSHGIPWNLSKVEGWRIDRYISYRLTLKPSKIPSTNRPRIFRIYFSLF